jgi:hypothetical protein
MRTHPANVIHLVFGLAFLGIAAAWALTEAGVVDARAGWLLPLVLVVAGAVGLVASLTRGLNRSSTSSPAFLAVPEDGLGDEPADGPFDERGDEEPTTPL